MLAWIGRNWYLAAFVACVIAAWCAPAVGASGGPLHVPGAKIGIIALIFLICGLSLPLRALSAAAGRIRVHVFVQGFSFVLIPVSFLLVDRILAVLELPLPMRNGLLLAACLPTTISTCVALTRLSGGSEAIAICNSTIGNLVGIVATPMLVLLSTGRQATIPMGDIFAQLALMVVLPLAIGQVLRLVGERWLVRGRAVFSLATSLLLLVLVYLVFCDSFAAGLRVGAASLVAIIIIVAVAYPLLLAAAFAASGRRPWNMTRAERVAASLCASHKTAVLGVPMLSIMYAGDPHLPLLCPPLLIYHFVQLFIGTALAPRLRAWVQDADVPGSGRGMVDVPG
ncbi:MAG: bile acid:sodium symporter [Planctomycetes bacterium]|nr:bile acid:sodium symporter [Planctomycetota bacterium]